MKSTIYALLVCILIPYLTACYSYQRVTRTNMRTANDYRAKLTPGKKYHFTLQSGQLLSIQLDSIRGENLYGTVLPRKQSDAAPYFYEDTFDSMATHVTKVTVKKFNVLLTVIMIATPIVFVVATLSKDSEDTFILKYFLL